MTSILVELPDDEAATVFAAMKAQARAARVHAAIEARTDPEEGARLRAEADRLQRIAGYFALEA